MPWRVCKEYIEELLRFLKKRSNWKILQKIMEVVVRKNLVLGIAIENFDKTLSVPRNTLDAHVGII